MEFCALTSARLVQLARENIIRTYIGLADSVPETHRVTSPHFDGVLALNPFSFCNFIIGLRGDAKSRQAGIRELVQLALRQPALRVFAMTGDSPDSWAEGLEAAGFRSLHHLVQMVCEPSSSSPEGVELEESDEARSRAEVSQFMVDQFFAVNEPRFRKTVMQATIENANRLLAVRDRGVIIGAVMLSEDNESLGLYNLCVHPRARRCGIGMSIVRAVQREAIAKNVPILLQCDRKLAGWYRRGGFAEFGEIQSFHHRF